MELIVPWREQMEPPTNHWALHSPASLKKTHHKQQHWLCSPTMHLCFYIHSGVLTKMWACPCAILQAEIQLCVTNTYCTRHRNPQTQLVPTPPRHCLLNASPSSRSQSVGFKIPSWACVPAGELGKTSLRISKNWRVDMCEVERNQGKKIQKVQLLHFLISRKNCTRVLWLAFRVWGSCSCVPVGF